ncbi:MAG: alpha-L-fucosidase [Bacteroidales bacterium]
MKIISRIAFTLILSLSYLSLWAQPYQANWESLDKRPVPAWFTDAKFGIFIHWGVYSVPAWAPADADIGVYARYAEWYWNRLVVDDGNAHKYFREHHEKMYGTDFKYQDFAPMFRAEFFNPDEWADVFKKSGARYIVLTSKHHEGFTLWPSRESWNWNAVDIGPHRDLAGDLSAAVKKAGLHMGFYYSLYEWFNPLYLENLGKYVDEHMIPQMKDLVTRYQPDLLWTDGEWEHPSTDWRSEEFLAWLYNESSVKEKVVVNDRWGSETRSKHGGIYTTEYNLINDKEMEGEIPHPVEECRGIGTSFGYNRIETLKHYMSSEALIHLLIEKVANGSNLLLDIGPTADGLIPVVMQERLLDMGKWLDVNGEAIYGTGTWKKRPVELQKEGVYFTRKGNELYVIFTKWPSGPVKIAGVKSAGNAEMIGGAGVKATVSGGALKLNLPASLPVSLARNAAWVVKVNNFEE